MKELQEKRGTLLFLLSDAVSSVTCFQVTVFHFHASPRWNGKIIGWLVPAVSALLFTWWWCRCMVICAYIHYWYWSRGSSLQQARDVKCQGKLLRAILHLENTLRYYSLRVVKYKIVFHEFCANEGIVERYVNCKTGAHMYVYVCSVLWSVWICWCHNILYYWLILKGDCVWDFEFHMAGTMKDAVFWGVPSYNLGCCLLRRAVV
jgi:hypothetical protein